MYFSLKNVYKIYFFRLPASSQKTLEVPANVLRRRSEAEVNGDDKELVADEQGSMMPRWKRDLLREAPSAGMFAVRGPKRTAAPAISKARRLREMERMTDENENDVRKLIGYENQRRRSSQVNMFMTMARVRQNAETLSEISHDSRE